MATTTLSATRFAVAAVFCASTALSAFFWISLSPIQPLVSTLFDVSALQINTISALFYILYLPGSLLCVWTMERWGLRHTLVIGAILNAACGLTKWAAAFAPNPYAFYLLVGGQVVGALGQPLILNPITRLSCDWFGDKERDVATALGTQANISGQLVAMLVVPALVTDLASLQLVSGAAAIPAVVVAVLTAVVVRNRPPCPPSDTAAAQWRLQDEDAELIHGSGGGSSDGGGGGGGALGVMWRDMQLLFANRNFNLINASFSIVSGMAWSLLTVQSQMLAPCGYSSTVVGASGAALLGLGIVTAMAIAPLLACTRAYAALQRAVGIGCLLSTVAVVFYNRPGDPVGVILSWLLRGAFIQPLLPLSLEHAAEVSYPIEADLSSAVLQTCGNLVAIAQTYALSPLLNMSGSVDCSTVYTPAAAFVLACAAAAALVALPITSDNRRQAAGAKAAGLQREPGGENFDFAYSDDAAGAVGGDRAPLLKDGVRD